MIKTYYSINTRHLTTTVAVGESRVAVSFRNHLLTTGDHALQQALEADSGYGREFTLRPTAEPAPATEKEAGPPPTPVEEVANKQQAVEYLAVRCGLDLKPTTSLTRIRAAAAAEGIVFPNL